MRKHPILYTVVVCALSVAVTLIVCICGFSLLFGGVSGLRDALQIAEGMRAVEKRFVGATDQETLTDGALAGIAEATGDRWSYYMNAEQYAYYLEASANQYTGVGITVQPSEDGRGLLIVSVQEDSPAERAGIQRNMILLSINGNSMASQSADYAKQIISAAGEQELTLVLLTKTGETWSTNVRAETLKVRVVKDELREDGLGYIRIRNFDLGAAEAAIAAVDRMLEQGAKGIIFDVRNNPGGKLTELITLLDYLLPEGRLFTSRDRYGDIRTLTSGPDCIEIPMVVLIDGDSYSAAEFFAAALSEYGWATTVGEQTTGKARSQINIKLSNGGVMHLSTESYLTPNGVDLAEQGGLTPDIEVALTEEGDAQLDAAAQCLLEAALPAA